jgi:hypothetical protein
VNENLEWVSTMKNAILLSLVSVHWRGLAALTATLTLGAAPGCSTSREITAGDPDDIDDASSLQDDDDDDDDDDGNGENESDESAQDDDDEGSDNDSLNELPLFDLADLPTLEDNGLEKCPIDFLFVIDNSGSMEDEQKNLVNSFPNFIDGIRETVQTDDFRILVVDSDAAGPSSVTCINGDCMCTGEQEGTDVCCEEICLDSGNKTCEGKPCSDYPPGSNCNTKLGSGRIRSGTGMECNVQGDRRFLLGQDPTLPEDFACIASVGINGDGDEQVNRAMYTAVSDELLNSGGCNEGFLRKNSVLVTVVITDEDDKAGEGSGGDPREWHDKLVAAKGGAEQFVVAIGFISDTDLPGAICMPFNEEQTNGAEAAPRMNEFIDLFGEYGLKASVCLPDYGPAFSQAIGKIDAACDILIPK